MECKKQIKRLFSVTLPSAMAMTLSKVTTWEHAWEYVLPSAQAIELGKGGMFAECLAGGTRHSGHVCRVFESTALGKEATFAECLTLTLGKAAVTATFFCRVCRVPDKVHSTKRFLPINCLSSTLCRVYIGLCRVPEALGKEAESGSVCDCS